MEWERGKERNEKKNKLEGLREYEYGGELKKRERKDER